MQKDIRTCNSYLVQISERIPSKMEAISGLGHVGGDRNHVGSHVGIMMSLSPRPKSKKNMHQIWNQADCPYGDDA